MIINCNDSGRYSYTAHYYSLFSCDSYTILLMPAKKNSRQAAFKTGFIGNDNCGKFLVQLTAAPEKGVLCGFS